MSGRMFVYLFYSELRRPCFLFDNNTETKTKTTTRKPAYKVQVSIIQHKPQPSTIQRDGDSCTVSTVEAVACDGATLPKHSSPLPTRAPAPQPPATRSAHNRSGNAAQRARDLGRQTQRRIHDVHQHKGRIRGIEAHALRCAGHSGAYVRDTMRAACMLSVPFAFQMQSSSPVSGCSVCTPSRSTTARNRHRRPFRVRSRS